MRDEGDRDHRTPTGEIKVGVATASDVDGLVETLAAAFRTDPVWTRVGAFATPDTGGTVATMWRDAVPRTPTGG